MGTSLKSREVVILFYAIPCLFLLFEFYLAPDGSIFQIMGSQLLAWVVILYTFSYLLGGYALFRYHLTIIQQRREGFEFSILLLACFFFFLALGLLKSATGFGGYDFVWSNVLLPTQIAMLSFVGFYTYTVFFRGARSRSWEAGLLLFVTILLMLYQAPASAGWFPIFETIGNWIKNVPNTAGNRAILIGMAVGMIAVFVRTLLGLERAQIGEK
jgi:hypothetical protein